MSARFIFYSHRYADDIIDIPLVLDLLGVCLDPCKLHYPYRLVHRVDKKPHITQNGGTLLIAFLYLLAPLQ